MNTLVYRFAPFALSVSLLLGVFYISLQQDMRVNRGNNPQIQLAEDIKTAIEAGADPSGGISSSRPIDIARSLSPYAIIFDDTMQPITSSGLLDGKIPIPPKGVFDYTRANGQDRISWEPKSGVRSAIVMMRYGGQKPGFVLVGRSLREIEEGIQRLEGHVLLGWAGSLIIIFIGLWALNYLKRGSL